MRISPNAPMVPALAKVDPLGIVIDPRYLKPTDWDLAVVAEDLKDYVQLSRLIKATPVLQIAGEALLVISGEPFVRAAREITPAIEEIVCLVHGDEQSIRSLSLKVVTASQMLDEVPAHEVYEAFEMVRFGRPLDETEKKAVEDQISGLFEDISTFAWIQENSRVHWSWRRTDLLDDNNLRFLEVLRMLNRSVTPVTSWNGLSPDSLL